MVLTDSIQAVSGLADLTEASRNINFLGHKVWLGSRSTAQSRKARFPRGASLKILIWKTSDIDQPALLEYITQKSGEAPIKMENVFLCSPVLILGSMDHLLVQSRLGLSVTEQQSIRDLKSSGS